MLKVFRSLAASIVLVYSDDYLLMGKDPADIFKRIDEVFMRFRGANLRIHPAKYHWAVN